MELLLDVINEYVIDDIEIEDIQDEFDEYIRNNPESNIDNIDDYIRVVKLMQAGVVCSNEQSVLLYTYVYGLMRCYAIFKVISFFEELKGMVHDLEKTLIVDFGCGPATVALAFGYYYSTIPEKDDFLDIHYIGKDISTEMIDLAKYILGSYLFNCENQEVSLNDTIFDEEFGEEYYIDPTEVYVNNYIDPENILFVFSYIFSQKDIVDEVDTFIEDINETVNKYESATEYYIMYLNSDYQKEGGAYDLFITKLENAGFKLHTNYFRGNPWMERDHYSSKAIREFDIAKIVNLYSGPLYYQFYRITKV